MKPAPADADDARHSGLLKILRSTASGMPQEPADADEVHHSRHSILVVDAIQPRTAQKAAAADADDACRPVPVKGA